MISQKKKYEFTKASYLSQVKQLRLLAKAVIARYDVQLRKLDFIQHGENATFKITAKNGKNYLLRIHRGGYHTPAAIHEELQWLRQLSKKKFLKVPKPMASRKGRWLEFATTVRIPDGRICCLFEWIDGHHIRKNLRMKHMYQLGQLIATLQSIQPQRSVQHRRYWLAEGLVGKKPKFGSIDHLQGISHRHQQIISKGRALCFQKLKQFQKKYPKRTGMIHADMHFGNFLQTDGQLAAIDFDDCGVGFFTYDLAVAIMSMRNILEKNRKQEIPSFQEALIDGYTSLSKWDKADKQILSHLLIARELMAVSWLNSRSDNPSLQKHLKPIARRVVSQIKREYGY